MTTHKRSPYPAPRLLRFRPSTFRTPTRTAPASSAARQPGACALHHDGTGPSRHVPHVALLHGALNHRLGCVDRRVGPGAPVHRGRVAPVFLAGLAAATLGGLAVSGAPPAGAALPAGSCSGLTGLTAERRAELRGAMYGYIFSEGGFNAARTKWFVDLPAAGATTSVRNAMIAEFKLAVCANGYESVTTAATSVHYDGVVDATHPLPVLSSAQLAADPLPVAMRRGFVVAALAGEGTGAGMLYDEYWAYHHDWYGLTPRENARQLQALWDQALVDGPVTAALTTGTVETLKAVDVDGDGVISSPNRTGIDEAKVASPSELWVTGSVAEQRRYFCSLPILRWDRAPGKFLGSGSSWDGTTRKPTVCGS